MPKYLGSSCCAVEPRLRQIIELHAEHDPKPNGSQKSALSWKKADETIFWLEMLQDCEIVPAKRLTELLAEAHELTALFTASRQTAKAAR